MVTGADFGIPPVERPEIVSPTKRLAASAFAALKIVVAVLAVMWLVEVIDAGILNDAWQKQGIQPRRQSGLDGIAFAPFLHVGFGHLIGNSVPFLILGGLVALRGPSAWVRVTLTIVILGGGLTWLLAGGGTNHVGASGIVFGYFGFLITAAVRERKFTSIVAAAITLLLYSGFVWGVVPEEGISWEGHLFGAVAGGIAAWDLKPRSRSAV